MFQDFTATASPENGPPRIEALRQKLSQAGLAGFLVPRADAHQGEYVSDHDARLAWLTGFTGSAGFAVILADQAALFIDGRYTLAAGDQVDTGVLTLKNIPGDKLSDYLNEAVPEGGKIGFDAWLHTARQVEDLRKALRQGRTLIPIANPVDTIWEDQPPPPAGPAKPHPEHLSGKSHAVKRAEIADTLRKQGIATAVLTLPDSISWLLNIRGADLARIPVVQAFALINDAAKVQIFVDPAKIVPETAAHLGAEVAICRPEDFAEALAGLMGKVGVDRDSAPVWISERIAQGTAEVKWIQDPCRLPKACKTEAELSGVRQAQARDGTAMVEFLCWLDHHAPEGALSEIDVVRALEAKRRASNALCDISFDTICGSGPNGAIVHYRVTETTNRSIQMDSLLLVDSGAQYLDGTTDITRTIAVGQPPEGATRAFTLVLKGMIAISLARWPAGLAGRDLDALARQALWSAGFDYDHGTGHGVGAYLSVHEGPQNISRRGEAELHPGMILSNEPGYYKAGAYGIRIENLVVVAAATVPQGGDRPMLGFETLTYVPIDRRLIDPNLLTAAELEWLNNYHATVRQKLASSLSPEAAEWLVAATAPI
ncbi:MAG: aminopeptidase P family protein [Pseudomonadota bacterium]